MCTITNTLLLSTVILALLTHTTNSARSQTNPVWGRLVSSWISNSDMRKFLLDAYVKMGDVDCTIVIWDGRFSSMLDSLTFCHPTLPHCAHKYVINYSGANISDSIVATFKAAYQEQCGSYIMLLSQTSTVTKLLHIGDDSRMINTRARFLIWYGAFDTEFEADDIWKKIPNVILVHSKTKKRNSYGMTFTIMRMIWPIIPGSKEKTKILDFWRHGKLRKNEENWYYDKTTDLKNATIRILVVEHPPGVIKYSSQDETTVEYAGTEVELVKELSSIMNFNFVLVDADTETKWGGQNIRNSSRKFYGAVARLIYGETDMAIGSFFILKHYLEFLDMSVPLDVACTSFLTPTPLPRPRYLALILPFRYTLWALVVSICFIFAPAGLYILTKAPLLITEYRAFSGRLNAVFSSISILSQVALHVWPKFWPVRMFIGWYWIFCLLVTLVYRGAMVSFLTIPLYEKPVDNLNDLAASSLRFGGWGIELQRLFTRHQNSSSTIASSNINLLSQRYELIEDVEEGISRVAEGNFALYENIRYLKFILKTRNLTKVGAPSMRLMNQCIVPVHIGIAYQKNSPITGTIDKHIRRFQESGLMKRWSQRLISTTKMHYKHLTVEEDDEGVQASDEGEGEGSDDVFGSSDNPSSSKQQRKQRILSIQDLQGSIYLILFGVILSVVAFVTEILVTHSKQTALNVNKELKKIVEKSVQDKSKITNMTQEIIPMINQEQKTIKLKIFLRKMLGKLRRRKPKKEKITLYPYVE